jgi:hypothetical protein
MTDAFSEGDEVVIKEFRTKIDMPGSTGAWVTVSHSETAPRQAFLPYAMMDKVQPEVKVGDVWRGSGGIDWYVRKAWASCDGFVIECFTSCSVTYSSVPAVVGARPIEKFFEVHKPTLVYRRDASS